MFRKRASGLLGFVIVLLFYIPGCNMVMENQTGATPGSSAVTNSPAGSTSDNEMQVRFVNLTDGETVQATLVQGSSSRERPLVVVQVEVAGAVASDISLKANGLIALDEMDGLSLATNSTGVDPFQGEIRWSPVSGGGDYTLVISAMSVDKQVTESTIHITVSGVPVFTPTPPPLDQAAAVRRVSELIQQSYGVSIPAPSVERFDFPDMPNRSRWIGAAYYQGQRYYIELYDDTHYDWSNGVYTGPAHKSSENYYVYCTPTGLYKVLVLFVDYGNVPGVDKPAFLAQVPVMTNWINGIYADYAALHGLAEPLLRIQSDAAFIETPPSPGALLRLDEIRSMTGFDPASYDFVMQIDLDANNTFANTNYPGLFTEPGGGLALQGCGSFLDPQVRINVWSSLADVGSIQGALAMDFGHEMSHLFGMMDSWPFKGGGLTLPDGNPVDDWLPYSVWGWTDADGDRIPEIIDTTPYGTNGPQP